MEEIIGFVGFTLGASAAVSLVRSIGGGSKPVVREAMKAGLRAWDTMAQAGGAAREGVASLQAEARQEQAQQRAKSRRRTQPQKIAIAHD